MNRGRCLCVKVAGSNHVRGEGGGGALNLLLEAGESPSQMRELKLRNTSSHEQARALLRLLEFKIVERALSKRFETKKNGTTSINCATICHTCTMCTS
jgi:hypothetical protein